MVVGNATCLRGIKLGKSVSPQQALAAASMSLSSEYHLTTFQGSGVGTCLEISGVVRTRCMCNEGVEGWMWPFLYDHGTRLCTISGIHNQGPRHLRKSKVGGGDRFHQGNCLSHVAGCPDCGHGPFPESVIHSSPRKLDSCL